MNFFEKLVGRFLGEKEPQQKSPFDEELERLFEHLIQDIASDSEHTCKFGEHMNAYFKYMSQLTTEDVISGKYARVVQEFIRRDLCKDILEIEDDYALPFAGSVHLLEADGAPFLNVGAGIMLVEPLYIKELNPNSAIHVVDPKIAPELQNINVEGITTEIDSFWCNDRFHDKKGGYDLSNAGIVIGGPCTSLQDVALQCKEDHPFMVRICGCDTVSVCTGKKERVFDIADVLNATYPSFKIANLPYRSPNSGRRDKPKRVLTNLILPECFKLAGDYESNKHKSNQKGLNPAEFVLN